MQKSRMYLLFAINTVLWLGAVMLLLRFSGFPVEGIVALGIILAMAAPVYVVNLSFRKHSVDEAQARREIDEYRQDLGSLKSKFAEVTTLDDLTGCSNQRHFISLIGQHKAMSERGTYEFTVVVIQVDQFADIVDHQSLARANEVLQLFARLVKASLREVDVIARLEPGSDKFGLLLSDCAEEGALIILDRISQLVSQIQVNEKNDVKITASGGTTSFHGTESPTDLIEHAVEAMQFAVEQGRDRIAGYNYTEPDTAKVNHGG